MRHAGILVLLTVGFIFSDASLALAKEKTKPPLTILRYMEVYRILDLLSDKLWFEDLPYHEMPVLHYDIEGNEEYLINHPHPKLDKYEATEFIINSKPVYKKRGILTFPNLAIPGACCFRIDGFPTAVIGGNRRTEKLVDTLIHEGFHFYQKAALIKVGGDWDPKYLEAMTSGHKEYPHSQEHEQDHLTMLRTLFVILLFSCGATFANDNQLNCTDYPGERLCRGIHKVDSYVQPCTGDACYDLWRRYLRSMGEVTSFYYDVVTPGYTASEQIGELAQKLARRICRQEITGEHAWIEAVTVAENRLLTALKEIQEASDTAPVCSCTKVVH